MKTKNAASRPIPTAAQLKKQRVRRVSCIILRILLVLSTILFTWITCWGCGLGWISRARAGSNWPMSFVGYGQMLLVGSGLLTLGTVLVLLCRKNWLNWAAAGSAAGGVVLCLLALYHVASYAKEHSFYSQLMQMPAGDAVLRTDPAGDPALCLRYGAGTVTVLFARGGTAPPFQKTGGFGKSAVHSLSARNVLYGSSLLFTQILQR